MDSASLSNLAPELSRALQTWTPRRPAEEAFAVVSVPAPLADPAHVFAAAQSQQSFLWAPGDGAEFVVKGVAAEIRASGERRFETMKDEVVALLGSVKSLESDAPAPRVFGGFSFHPNAPAGELWQGFDAARFVLPRTCYTRAEGRAWVSLSVRHEELSEPSLVQRLIAETVAWLEELTCVGREQRPTAPPASFRMHSLPDHDGWARLIGDIKAEIASGHFQKIVAARRAVCRLEPPPRVDRVLLRLDQIAHDCTRFALRRDGKLFLGATPEWLVRKRGRHLQTGAMAGSRSSREADAETHLLQSHKDLGEHRLVVDEILSVLSPLSTSLVAPPEPGVRRLRDILHLYTPISATLAGDAHVLDLVARLHPTPAVGGAPREAAHRWIAEHEEDRGWYASPIGWVDGQGDGQFVVALRSALLVGSMAHIFAGAGIVEESDVELEFEETELKLAAMINALGAG